MKTKAFKKTLSICLSLLMALGVFALPAGILPTPTANAASVWDGSIGDPGWSFYHYSGNDYYLESANALVYFLNRIANQNTFAGKTVHLMVDVDLANRNFGDSVWPYNTGDNYAFQGTFDGGNHTISNFTMTSSNHRVALFRTAKNATFRNLNFENVFIDDNSDSNKKNGFAALVGFINGDGYVTFENIHVNSGNIYGYNYVGAIAGEVAGNDSGSRLVMNNCSNGATINSLNVRIGGLAGSSLPAVYATNCTNTGNVTAGSTDVGGIVGWIEDDPSSFVGCTNTGNIQGKDAVGGIIGYFGNSNQDQKMTLLNNVNQGNITATTRAGGIAGHLETDCNSHEITGNVNYGSVTTTNDDAGGIMGRNKGFGVWTNNKNYGAVTSGGDNAGGIVGEIEDDKQVFTNCQNAGVISGKNSTGGIVGWLSSAADNEFTRCFNTGAITSNSSYAGGIAGRGSKQLTCTECFNIGTIQSSGDDSGGLVGSIDYHTFFYRCFNAGSVTAPSNKSAGGMIGYSSYNGGGSDINNPQVVDCFNWGAISAGTVGGIAGYINGGNTKYFVKSSYNAGYLSGNTRWSGVGHGGAIDTGSYRLDTDNGGGSATAISAANLENNNNVNGTFISSNFCKNTWGVRIGTTTYKYPILTWYRDMFSFQFNFVDSATGTNETILKNYGESFTVPNPTRSGYSAGQWLSGNTHRLVRGSTVTAGDTYLTNTNYDKSAGPADTNTVVQSFTEPTEIRSTKTYGLTWHEGAAANMYATSWANEENNTDNRYRAGIDYTIYNLTTGHNVVYTDNSATDYTSGNSQYFKSYQKNGTGAAAATLEVDRSLMSDISETGIYIDYYPFIYTGPGGVRWGIEIFDPNHADSKGVLNNDHWTATVTGTSGKSYTYEQRFNDVNGSDHRCAETSSDFTQEPSGTAATERRYGSYKWYFKGAAPDFGDSVTLRITAICASRYNSGNLQILSEWTDLTIIGTCTHANGHLHAYQANAATCTEDGNSAYWYCDVCHKYFSDAAATHEIAENSWVLPATDHAWGQPTYVWAADNSSVTATRICANDPTNHVETETVDTTSETGLEPTCTEKGKTIYTAVFTNPAFATQTKTVEDIDALDHDWNAPTYVWSDDGHSVTATRTCNNGNHPETETLTLGDGITSAVKTPANCSVMGTTTYTATFTNPAFGTQSKDVQDIATNNDHDWGEPTYVWTDDGHSVTATRVCNRDGEHIETETRTLGDGVTSAEKTPANCSVKGWTTYTATFTNPAFTQQTKDVQDIETNDDHAWGEAAYEWSDDGHTCTASRVCARDGEHVETETATLGHGVTAAVKSEPDCSEKGWTTYTATFTNPAFQTQTKDVQDIPTNDVHDWNEPTYEWADDGRSITATRTCNNGDHPETETLTLGNGITATEKTPANCNEKGWTTYTATFTNPAFAPQTKDVQDIETNDDHDWGTATYEWSDDGHSITVTRVCARNAAHVETETLTLGNGITATEKTPANCNEKGWTTYTATFTNIAFTQQTKDVQDIETNDDHAWGEAAYEWSDDGHSITATRVCSRNAAHVETETLTLGNGITATEKTPANCNEKGWTTYTATFTNTAFETQTKDVQDIETNDDHAWGEAAYEWSDDGHSITATRVCSRNAAHVETETLTLGNGITATEKTPANCNEKGWTTYTATFTNTAFAQQTKDVQDIETNDDHAWGEATYEWSDDGHSITATRVCSRNAAHVETETLTLGNGITATEKTPANCNEKGTTTYTATFTNEAFETQTKDVQDIETNNVHTLSFVAAVEGVDCRHFGAVAHYHCALCGKDFADEAATEVLTDLSDNTYGDHTLSFHAAVEGVDCQHFGTVAYYECAVCGNKYADEEATETLTDLSDNTYGEHTWEWVEDLAPSCGTAGVKHQTCAVCGETQNAGTVIPAIGNHDWDEGTWVKRATCLEGGSMRYTCRRCGETKTEAVDALGHDIKILEAREPTCNDRGITEGTMCRRCGAVLTPQIVISELGHDYGEWVKIADPTCTEAGREERTCSRCEEDVAGHVDVREIPATGHTFGDWTETTPAACTAAGEKTRVCSVCGESETAVIKALGHDYVESEGTTATCTEGGTVVYTCSRCGDSYSGETAALGHNWGAWETVKEATIEENGLERRTCARCGETEENETVFVAPMDRKVQFVAGVGLEIVIHMGQTDLIVNDQSSRAVNWYAFAPLTFEVRRTGRFSADGYVVMINQQAVAADANGVYTLPAGSAYAIVSAEPLFNPTPATPSSSDGVCKLCGKDHGSTLWGRIVAFFHMIIWFFKNLFKF